MVRKNGGVMFKPVTGISLADAVADQIKAMILNGSYKPGDRLPTESELMRQLDVGRSTVREALKSLAMAGLVESRRTAGTFVPTEYHGFLHDKLNWTALLSEQEITNIAQVRLALEGESAMLAATRATTEDQSRLTGLFDQLAQRLDQPEAATESDLDFHLTIAEASHNKLLVTLVHSLRNLIHDFIKMGYVHRVYDEHNLEQHRRILTAIERADGAGAKAAMADHLNQSAMWMVEYARKHSFVSKH